MGSLAGPGSSTFALPTLAGGRRKSPAAGQSCLWDCSSALGSVTLCSLPYPSSEALRGGVWVPSAPGIVLKTSNIFSGSGSYSLPPFGKVRSTSLQRGYSHLSNSGERGRPCLFLKTPKLEYFLLAGLWYGMVAGDNTLFVHSLISPRESMRWQLLY